MRAARQLVHNVILPNYVSGKKRPHAQYREIMAALTSKGRKVSFWLYREIATLAGSVMLQCRCLILPTLHASYAAEWALA